MAKHVPQTTLTSALESAKPMRFLDYREFLRALYNEVKLALPTYTYLKFSEDMGLSYSNALHQVIQGRRPLSLKAAEKIISSLHLSGQEKQYLLILVEHSNSKLSEERSSLLKRLMTLRDSCVSAQLEKEQLSYYSEWYHPVIREMVLLPDFNPDPYWIADRLDPRVRPEQVKKSLVLLERLKLIERKNGKYCVTSTNVTTGDEVSDLAVLRYHQNSIDLGKDSIMRVEDSLRDISGVTVAISEETAEKIKDELRHFRKKVLALAEQELHGDNVYQLNIQFFPMTKKGA